MTTSELTEIEVMHVAGKRRTCAGCNYDVEWPCDAVALVEEIKRLREFVRDVAIGGYDSWDYRDALRDIKTEAQRLFSGDAVTPTP